jgi:hypothetical protein
MATPRLVGLPSALPRASGETLEDIARENRIQSLVDQYNRAAAFGAVSMKLTNIWEKLAKEIKARSPAQVARMERAKGLVR